MARLRRPAVFLDRDGTINKEMGYVNHISRFILIEGVPEAVELLNRNNYLVLVTTNQSGVARGYFPMELLYEVHKHMSDSLGQYGARIDRIYCCPHHPDGVISEYRISCDCRKPKTGLFKRALADFEIDLERSYVIGDRVLDMQFASACGVPGIMVETGYGLGESRYILPNSPFRPIRIEKNLLSAVRWILGNPGQ